MITEQIQTVCTTLDDLEKSVSNLREKCIPAIISTPETVLAELKQCGQETHSPISNSVEDINQRLIGVTRRINSLVSELDL